MTHYVATARRKMRGSMRRFYLPIILVTALALAGSQAMAAEVFSPEERQQALANAVQYARLQYRYEDTEHRGVAYLLGGQDTIESFLEKLNNGAEPGEEIGIDASGLVINAFKSVYPQLRFAVPTGAGKETFVSDVSSKTLYVWNTEKIGLEQLTPGDLIFFGTSEQNISGVALYAGRAGNSVRIVVASSRQQKVVETGLTVGGDYWSQHVVGMGRLMKH